jgi:hypothetical protein
VNKSNKIIGGGAMKIISISIHVAMLAAMMVLVTLSACVQYPRAPGNYTGSPEWRCSQIDQASIKCVESQDGQEWAKENCKFNGTRTVCPIVDTTTNQQYLLPVENINLSSVNKCLRYVGTCTEETQFRKVNYELNITQ